MGKGAIAQTAEVRKREGNVQLVRCKRSFVLAKLGKSGKRNAASILRRQGRNGGKRSFSKLKKKKKAIAGLNWTVFMGGERGGGPKSERGLIIRLVRKNTGVPYELKVLFFTGKD